MQIPVEVKGRERVSAPPQPIPDVMLGGEAVAVVP
jgi:hypothetical protein